MKRINKESLFFFRETEIIENLFARGRIHKLYFLRNLWIRPRAHHRVEHLEGTSHKLSQVLLANIVLGWNSLPGAKTLACPFVSYGENKVLLIRAWDLKAFGKNKLKPLSSCKWYSILRKYGHKSLKGFKKL
jgi:hypothetical protein